MQRERPLHAHAEGQLAHGERLARAGALALDHDALEDLGAAAGALDHLEVDAHAVARLEDGNAAQLSALEAFDHSLMAKEARPAAVAVARAGNGSEGPAGVRPGTQRAAAACARPALLEPPLAHPRVVAREQDLRTS